jgi:hypothetical protein
MTRIVPKSLAGPALAAALGLVAPALVAPAPAHASAVPAVVAAKAAGLTLGKHYVEVSPGVWLAVKGERERRNVRFARLVAFWSLEQKSVAADEGFPHHRWRELYDGRNTETWFYPDRNRQYVFDVDSGKLLKKSRR